MPEEQLVVRAILRDELSRGLKDIRQEVRATRRELEQMTGRRATRNFSRFERGLRSIDRVGSGLGRTVTGLGRTFTGAGRALAGFGRAASNALRPLASLGRGALNVGQTIATMAAGAAVALGTLGIRATADAEMMQVAFQGITGSASRAQELMLELRSFAARTPFEIPELTGALQRILAVQSGGFAQEEDPFGLLEVIGNVTSLFGGGANELNAVMRAVAQISGSGRLLAQDINQITQALPGFNVRNVIAQQLGITQPELMELAEQGLVPAHEGLTALLNGMAAYPGAAGAMDRASQTLTGLWSTFKDSIRIALIDGITPFLPQLKDLVRGATPLFERLVRGAMSFTTVAIGWVREHWPAISRAASASWRVVSGVFRGIVNFVRTNWPTISAIFSAVADVVRHAFTDVIGPAASGLGETLMGVFGWIADNWPRISGYITDAFRAIVDFWNNTFYPDVIAPLIDLVERIWPDLQIAVQNAMAALSDAWDQWGKDVFDALLFVIENVAEGLAEISAQFHDMLTFEVPGWFPFVGDPVGQSTGSSAQRGDTSRSRAGGGGSAGMLAALAGMLGGRVTNVGHGGFPGSDHFAGRAVDVAGPFMGRFANAVQAMGGFAERHGAGPGRHVHAAYGDTVRPRAAGAGTDSGSVGLMIAPGGVTVTVVNPKRPGDVRREVMQALRQIERDRRERG